MQRMYMRKPREIPIPKRNGMIDRLRKGQHCLCLSRTQVVRREGLIFRFLGGGSVGRGGRCGRASHFIEGCFDRQTELFILVVYFPGGRVRAFVYPTRLGRDVPLPARLLGFREAECDRALQIGVVPCSTTTEGTFRRYGWGILVGLFRAF